MLIEYYKAHTDVKNPTRGHPSDAGLDVFFCPERGTDKFADAVIKPGHGAILATGLMFGVPHGYMLEVKNDPSFHKVGRLVKSRMDLLHQKNKLKDLYDLLRTLKK